MANFSDELMSWLNGGHSPWHTVAMAANFLTEQGFVPLPLGKPFHVARGGRYFVENETALIAVSVGAQNVFRVAAAHTDWPCMRVKPEPELTGRGGGRLSAEPYGGAIFNSWMDRPLGLAGAVMVRTGDPMHPQARLVDWDEPLAVIPNLAIHMNREVNKGAPYRANVEMLPIYCTPAQMGDAKNFLVKRIAERLDITPDEVLSFVLYAYCADPAARVGFAQDMISAPRLDNLTSVHAVLRGLVDAEGPNINVAVLYDNEEIGNNTRHGADSSTLNAVLEKLAAALGLDRAAMLDACANGMLLSCDVAHALHPNRPEMADPVLAPVMGGGVALKSSPRYASDAATCAVVRALCDRAGIPLQTYMNRADLPGGSTVGSVASALLAMPAADVGVPVLAMHSARELMGASDQDALVRLCTAFFSAE